MIRKVWRMGALTLLALGGGCHLVLGLDDYELLEQADPEACSVDQVRNGRETDVDCGGGICPACAAQAGCAVGADCESGVCSAGACAVPSCNDKIKNGDEIDIDCGGTCGKCGPNKECGGDKDCKSGMCMGGTCASTCSDTEKGGAETDVDCGGGAVSGCPACGSGSACKTGADCQSDVCHVDRCLDHHIWSEFFSGIKSVGVAVDGAGGVVLTAGLFGTVDFGGGPLTTMNSYDYDIVAAKFDASGKHAWTKRFAGDDFQGATDVSVNALGSVALTGYFDGTLQLSGPLVSSGGDNMFVAVLNSSGFPIWRKRFGGPGQAAGRGVAIGVAGNVVLTGSMRGSVDFGGGTISTSSFSDDDVVVIALDADGNHLWSKRFGDSSTQVGHDVAIDASGNVVVTGGLRGTTNFGGSSLISAGDEDVFVTKLSASGGHVWSKRFGDLERQTSKAIAIDGDGNVVVVGNFRGMMDPGGGLLDSAGGDDVFVVKFDAAGTHLWSKRFGDVEDDMASSVAVDGAGNIVVTGSFRGTINFGGLPLSSAGGTDVFIVEFDADGNRLWSKRFGGLHDEQGVGVAVREPQKVILTGQFDDAIDLGGGSSTVDMTVFLAKLLMP